MNARIIVIAVALCAPVVALAVMAEQADSPHKMDGPAHAKMDMVQAQDTAKATPVSTAPAALPPTAGKLPPRSRPANLEEAKARLRRRLADLEKMTPEQWEEEQQRKHPPRRRWDDLTPEQKLKALERRQQKIEQQQKRLPAVEGAPAQPPSDQLPPPTPIR